MASLADFAVHVQAAVVLLDNAVGHRQTQSATLPTGWVVKKGSKMRDRFSRAVPQPVSETSIQMRSLSRPVQMVILPRSAPIARPSSP